MYLTEMDKFFIQKGWEYKEEYSSFEKEEKNGYVLIQKLAYGQLLIQQFKNPIRMAVQKWEKTEDIKEAIAIAEQFLTELKESVS